MHKSKEAVRELFLCLDADADNLKKENVLKDWLWIKNGIFFGFKKDDMIYKLFLIKLMKIKKGCKYFLEWIPG